MMGASRFKDGRGARWCEIIESVKPGGRLIGNRTHHPEGIREERITARELVGWRQFPINQEVTSEGQTLGVPVGWNKPASHCGRRSCWEVAKTCGQDAPSLEARFARRVMMAL